jgi:hypothetical protein
MQFLWYILLRDILMCNIITDVLLTLLKKNMPKHNLVYLTLNLDVI